MTLNLTALKERRTLAPPVFGGFKSSTPAIVDLSPRQMEFKVGEGLTPEQQRKARENIALQVEIQRRDLARLTPREKAPLGIITRALFPETEETRLRRLSGETFIEPERGTVVVGGGRFDPVGAIGAMENVGARAIRGLKSFLKRKPTRLELEALENNFRQMSSKGAKMVDITKEGKIIFDLKGIKKPLKIGSKEAVATDLLKPATKESGFGLSVKEVKPKDKKNQAETILKRQIGDTFEVVKPVGDLWKSKGDTLYIRFSKPRTGAVQWLKNQNFVTNAQEAGGNNVIKIKIKSQLTDIFNQAKKPVNTQALREQAKKFDTAEEFMEAQGEPLFHGTPYKFDTFKEGKTTYFTPKESFAENYGSEKSMAREMDADIQILERFGNVNLFDGTKKSDIEKLGKLLPDEVGVLGPMAGMGGKLSKKEVLERMQGIFTQKTPDFVFKAKKTGEIFEDMSIAHSGTYRIKKINKDSVDAEQINQWGNVYGKDTDVYRTVTFKKDKTYQFKDVPYWRDFEGDTVIEESIKKLGYDGWVSSEKGVPTYAIFNPEKLKTKSQLTDIFNQAKAPKVNTQALSPIEEKQTLNEIFGIPETPILKEEMPADLAEQILNEARRDVITSGADEFVDSQLDSQYGKFVDVVSRPGVALKREAVMSGDNESFVKTLQNFSFVKEDAKIQGLSPAEYLQDIFFSQEKSGSEVFEQFKDRLLKERPELVAGEKVARGLGLEPQKTLKDIVKETTPTPDNPIKNIDEPPQVATTLEAVNSDGHIVLPETTKFQKFRRAIEDTNIKLKTLNQEIERISGKEQIENWQDLWAQKDMLPRKQSDILRRVQEEERNFVAELVEKGIRVGRMEDVLHAQHAKERNQAMKEYRESIGQEPQEGLSGMTDKKADELLKNLTPAEAEMAKKARNIAENTLDFLVEKGLIKQKEADVYKAKYENYVPLFRDVENIGGTGVGRGIDIRGKEIKRAKGSTKRVVSPLSNIFYNKRRAIVRDLQNQVAVNIVRLTEQYPDLKNIFEVEKNPQVPKGTAKIELPDGDVLSETVWGPKFTLKPNVIGAKINGDQYLITDKSPNGDLARAIKSTNLARVPEAVRFLRTTLGVWSAMKTRWRPEFIMTNFERDFGEAMINLQVEKTLLKDKGKNLRRDTTKNLPKAQKDLWRYLRGKEKKADADEFFRLGGDVGHFWGEDVLKSEKTLLKLEKEIQNQGVEKLKNTGRAVSDLIDHSQSVVELGVRFSAYRELVKRGMDKERAIQAVADMTINFSRQGEISPFLKAGYGFIQPAITGASKVIRTIGTKTGRGRVLRAVTALTVLGYATRLISMLIDEEGDEQISEWDKNHKISFAIGGGKHINLWNMPYGYSVFFALGGNLAEMQMGKKTVPETGLNVLKESVNSFSPFDTNLASFIPTLARPIFEINANKGWYDGPVYKEQIFTNTPVPDSQSYFNNTSKGAIFSSQFLNKMTGGSETKAGLVDVHPNTLQYMYNQYLGGPFEFLTSSIETGAEATNGNFDINKTPFVRQVIRDGRTDSWSYNVIYDTLERAWKKDISQTEKDRFLRAVQIGLDEKVFEQDKANGYYRDFFRARHQIQGNITDNIDKLNQMPVEDKKKLISTYAESTQKTINKRLKEKPSKQPLDEILFNRPSLDSILFNQ